MVRSLPIATPRPASRSYRLLLLLTLVLIALIRPVVKRRDAEAERAELQQQRQQELLESERQARHEARRTPQA